MIRYLWYKTMLCKLSVPEILAVRDEIILTVPLVQDHAVQTISACKISSVGIIPLPTHDPTENIATYYN